MYTITRLSPTEFEQCVCCSWPGWWACSAASHCFVNRKPTTPCLTCISEVSGEVPACTHRSVNAAARANVWKVRPVIIIPAAVCCVAVVRANRLCCCKPSTLRFADVDEACSAATDWAVSVQAATRIRRLLCLCCFYMYAAADAAEHCQTNCCCSCYGLVHNTRLHCACNAGSAQYAAAAAAARSVLHFVATWAMGGKPFAGICVLHFKRAPSVCVRSN
jgi:hypothetical protein